MSTQPELLLPLAETLLNFRVKVPEGCELVVALRTPCGQLVELTDLVAEDAAGVEVGRVPESVIEVDPKGEVTFRDVPGTRRVNGVSRAS